MWLSFCSQLKIFNDNQRCTLLMICDLSLFFRLFFLQSGPVQNLTPIAPAPQTLPPAISTPSAIAAISAISTIPTIPTIPTISTISTMSPYASERIPQEPSYQAPNDRLFYMTHNCTPDCLKRVRPKQPNLHRGRNPLLTPLLYEFRRMTARRRLNRKVGVWDSMQCSCSVVFQDGARGLAAS